MAGMSDKIHTVFAAGAVFRLLLISGSVIILDQVTKAVITGTLVLHESITVIPGLFDITHVLNPGGAFGLFARHSPGIRTFFFLIVSSLVACLILWFYRQTSERHLLLSCGLAGIFGGAVGNLIDRFRFGQVVDFLDFYIGNHHWPSFNIADSAISIGMAIFLYHVVFNKISDL
ncbi:MAG: signal peptidase II [Pseudomonadota bacterium]